MVSGNQQLVLLRGSDSHLYLAVVLGTEKGTTQVMEKFLNLVFLFPHSFVNSVLLSELLLVFVLAVYGR